MVKRWWRAINETAQTALLALALYTLINLALPRYMVEGRSMQPVFSGIGNERVLVNRLEYYLNDPERGDIVVLHNPTNHAEYYIKRLIGLPGESVQLKDGQVYIDGRALDEPYIAELCQRSRCHDQTWRLEPDQYFVLGDNRNNSYDSASFGPISRDLIIGRAWINYWPPQEWQLFEHFTYQIER
jgi:signal peptidase I